MLTIETYEEQMNDYNGYCLNCEEVTRFGDCEPDARGYECPECGGNTVYGLQECLIMGYVE